MNKYEFLNQLSDCLMGNVNEQERQDSIQYYRNYIEDEIYYGKTEQEVLEELGSPTSIAKSIIEAKGYDSRSGQSYSNYEAYEEESNSDSKPPVSGKVFQFEGWKIGVILVTIILVLILLLSFAFKLFVTIVPILLPFIFVGLILKIIFNRR